MTEQELIQLINKMPENNAMRALYRQSYQSITTDLNKWVKNYPNMTVSQQAEFKRQGQVAEHLADVMKGLDMDVNTNVLDTVKRVGALSYNGTYYNLEKKYDINLGSVLIDDKKLMQLVKTPVAGKNFSTRLHRNVRKLSNMTNQAIMDGLVRGESYQQIAGRIRDLTNMSYNNALRISRTEAGRVGSAMNYNATKEIQDKGIDVRKQWTSTLDRRTRTDHAALDNMIVGVDEYFKVNGVQALHPHGFGNASEDVNCRCVIVNVIDDIKPEFRRDNETGETIKDMSYNKWLAMKTGGSDDVSNSIFSFGGMISNNKAKEYANLLSNALPEIKNMYENTELTLKSTSNKGTAYYRPSDGVYISKDVSNDTFFHEFAHNIDHEKSNVSSKNQLKLNANIDWDNYLKEQQKEFAAEIKKHGITQFKEEHQEAMFLFTGTGKLSKRGANLILFKKLRGILNDPERQAVSDWLEGITKQSFPMGYGHGAKYHTYQGMTDKEIFAELTSLYVNHPSEMENIKKMFPTLISKYLETIKEIKQ